VNVRFAARGILFFLTLMLPAQGQFDVTFDKAGVTSLKHARGPAGADALFAGDVLGHVRIRYRTGKNEWREFSTRDSKNTWSQQRNDPFDPSPQQLIVYNESGWDDYFADLEVTERFRVEEGVFYWTLHIRNTTHKPLEISDIHLDLPFAGERRAAEPALAQWLLPGAGAPDLVMRPIDVCPLFEPAKTERNFTPSRFVLFDDAGLYIHRGPAVGATLSPKFSPDDEITYAFEFRWSEDRLP
jgi:hypothetical protein